jgi:hypothetical protein
MDDPAPTAVTALCTLFHRCVIGPQNGTVQCSGEPQKHNRPALPGEPAG